MPVLLNDKTGTWKGAGALIEKGREWLRTDRRAETNLESHDIEFPVFGPGTLMRVFRITLLTARDMEASNGLRRVAMLSHASGAKGAAVLFLLGDGGAGGEAGLDAMEAFMKLQVE